MNFLETYLSLDKLQEWKLMTPSVSSQPSVKTEPQARAAGSKKYQVTYYNDEVKKSFIITANSKAEAEQIAWEQVDAESMYVSELDEELDTLDEANKIVQNYANSSWYSGGFRGLNDISTAVTPEEREQRLKAEEERQREKERKEFESAAKSAAKAIKADRVPFYNCNNKYDIKKKEYYPAIDLDTKELVYDPVRKEEIIEASQIIVDQKRQAAAEKGRQTRAKNQAAQADIHLWTAYYTINGETSVLVDKVHGNDDPEGACLAIKQKAVDAIKQEMKECRVFGERFQWDGKLLITITYPEGNDKTYKQYKFTTTKA